MGGSSKSSGSSSATYQDSVWGGQQPALQQLYGQAKNLYGQTSGQAFGQMPQAIEGMQYAQQQTQAPWQDQLQGGAYRDMGLQNALMGSLNQSFNNPSAMSEINGMIMGGDGNNYADAMKESYISDANRAQQLMLGNLDARAAASGMSGGSRHGMAQGLGMEGINDQLQKNLASTGFNTFDRDLDRKLQIAGMADQNTLQRQQMLSGMIGQQQNTQNAGIQNGQLQQQLNMGQFAPMMVPWDMMGQYANTIGRPTILGSGSQSGSSDSKGASFG